MKRARAVFIDGDGVLRPAWRLALALIAGLGAYYAARAAAGLGLSKLFDAWNLNARTLPYAPAWARWLVSVYAHIINSLACLAAAGACLLTRGIVSGRAKHAARPRVSARMFALGLALGAAGALTALGIILLADSARLAPGGPVFSPIILASLVERLAASAFLALFLRAGISVSLGEGRRAYIAIALSVCAHVVLSGALARGAYVPRVLNACLAGVFYVLCLRLTGGVAFETGIAFAFASVSEVMFGFPSGGALETFPVSESWLTGGEHGLGASLIITLTLITACALYPRIARKRREIGRDTA